MKINLTVIKQPNFQHVQCYDEVIEFYYQSLKELNYDVIKSINNINPDFLNIIIGYHFLPYNMDFSKIKYIVIQLEQLGDNSVFLNQTTNINNILPILNNSIEIWDYSKENINFLSKYNLKTRLMPFGYNKSLIKIHNKTIKEIDVLFYGSLSQRRISIIENLKKECSCVNVFGVYGLQRDELISKSKIILNMHHNESKILQQVRLFYPMHNNCFVLSEETSWNPYSSYLITYPYDNLVDGILEWLKKDEERENHAKNQLQGLKNLYSKELIQRALLEIGK